jgi:hypothetical protein
MDNLLCMGLIHQFLSIPRPPGFNRADYGLSASMHVDVLYGDLLLTVAAMPIESVEQHGIGAG